MKKLSLFFCLTALVLCSAFTNTTWKPVELHPGITVSMPGKITEEKVQEEMLVHKADIDSFSTLTAMVVDYTRFGLTADILKQMAGTDEFLQQMKVGIESNGATILSTRKGSYQELSYYEFELQKEVEGKKVISVVRSVFYQQWGINLTYKYTGGDKNMEVIDRFFHSLKVAG